MVGLPFVKYTSFGNNFVIVDETDGPVLSEQEKLGFAYRATNGYFGVGSDNFLVVQACTREALKAINAVHHYWSMPPHPKSADYIFRMFEPDGAEALCCGNGLMCVANYLYRQYGISSARIMTEVPTARPRVISIGTDPATGKSWADMGEPRRMPETMLDRSIVTPYDDEIDIVEQLPISHYRKSDGLRFFTSAESFTLSGYLVFTGEPQLVIFTDEGFSIKEPGQNIFLTGPGVHTPRIHDEKRMSSSSALVMFIGNYFDRVYRNYFPAGININLVRYVPETGALEYRVFERGINRETLACGTGALACAFVARRLNILQSDRIAVWPHRCRWYQPDAEIGVERHSRGWSIQGSPQQLFNGVFDVDHASLGLRNPGPPMGFNVNTKIGERVPVLHA